MCIRDRYETCQGPVSTKDRPSASGADEDPADELSRGAGHASPSAPTTITTASYGPRARLTPSPTVPAPTISADMGSQTWNRPPARGRTTPRHLSLIQI